MIKIASRSYPNVEANFESLDYLAKCFKYFADFKNQSIMECVFEHYTLVIDGIEYTC